MKLSLVYDHAEVSLNVRPVRVWWFHPRTMEKNIAFLTPVYGCATPDSPEVLAVNVDSWPAKSHFFKVEDWGFEFVARDPGDVDKLRKYRKSRDDENLFT